jgi:hypothetical protein
MVAMSDGRDGKGGSRVKIERLCPDTGYGAFKIVTQLPRLLYRKLRGRRTRPALVSVWNNRTIAERPEIGSARHLHIRIGLQSTFFQWETQAFDKRMRLRAHGADNHSRLNPFARSKMHGDGVSLPGRSFQPHFDSIFL